VRSSRHDNRTQEASHATVIFENLVNVQTPLPPGGQVRSRTFNVNGAQQVNLSLGIPGPDDNVSATIYVGPWANGAFSPLRTDSFSWPNNTVFASIPVYGPELFVEFDNKGSQQQTCDGNIYAIQEVR
jgi:hypothetical protein